MLFNELKDEKRKDKRQLY